MKQRNAGPAYLLLFVPFALATMLAGTPAVSYFVAWLGSFAILALSFSGIIKPLPPGRSIMGQVLRPIVLTQIIFVSYTALTSIFVFLDTLGYYYFAHRPFVIVDDRAMELLAAGQRLYVLAHGALVAGLLLGMDYRRSATWRLRSTIDLPRFLGGLALASVLLATVGQQLEGPKQIITRLEIFGLVASVLSLTVAMRTRELGFTLIAAGIYVTNMVSAVLSGWKEEVTIVVMLFALFAYPMYKRTVLLLTPIAFAVMLFVLPAYMNIFRQLNWYGGVEPVAAARVAVGAISDGSVDLRVETWDFLAHRSSEINMFTRYIDHTPAENPFYGLSTLRQSAYGLVPRFAWANKPNLEALAMERAYQNGIVTRDVRVSAKPQFVADAYLCAGALGVFFACLIYGLIAATASRLAEYCFGGYLLGSGLMYNALFMSMWRGNAFEFISNDILWGFILLGVAFAGAYRAGWIVREVQPTEPRRAVRGAAVIAGDPVTPGA
jgi:hypothetical protein